MHQLLSDLSIADHWSPEHDIIHVSQLQPFVRSDAAAEANRNGFGTPPRRSPSAGSDNGRDWPNASAQRPPMQYGNGLGTGSSTISVDDPAFSGNPHHHPDHQIVPLNDSPVNTNLSSTFVFEDDPPPYESYEDSSSLVSSDDYSSRRHVKDQSFLSASSLGGPADSAGGSSHMREAVQVDSPTSSSLSSQIPRQEGLWEDQAGQEEELLAYLREDRDADDQRYERNIPMALRPHMGQPIAPQVPPESENRGRPGFDGGLLRNATLPPTAGRTTSEPFLPIGSERPRLPRRGNTTSPRRYPRATELDRIDELDETTPIGLPIHHRGPYELQRQIATPPPRAFPIQSEQPTEPICTQRFMVDNTPLAAPPPPVPFRLDLRPGEFLTRLPPARNQMGQPALCPPLAPITPIAPVAGAQSMRQVVNDPRVPYDSNGYREWSPEQLYESSTFSPAFVAPGGVSQQAYRTDPRSGGPSANPSRSDFRQYPAAYMSPESGYASADELRHERHVTFQRPAQVRIQSPVSPPRPWSQPSYIQSSASSVYSQSSSIRAHPSSADRHRPKKIVMPTPLQQQPTFMGFGLGASKHNAASNVAAQPAAANIPMHEPRKGNLLKKRASTSSSARQHLAPEHFLPNVNLNGFRSESVEKGSVGDPGPELKGSKSRRKLSKRRTAA
ncbi:hypothetical protein DFH11DRAFT_1739224 [Phellopilus nigrolimitatus]|nr:hypothetical protein DFH11DRAFT_1739224 [Phellopilus nigrolimitatus]